MDKKDISIGVLYLCGTIFLIIGICSTPKYKVNTPSLIMKESWKERYDVYSRCYNVTNDYEKALACIEIHKYLQGE